MKYRIILSERFRKDYSKLDTLLKERVKQKLMYLSENPFHPSLRTKKIKGDSNLFEMSVNMSVRIIWEYRDGNIIVLLAVGTHAVLERQ